MKGMGSGPGEGPIDPPVTGGDGAAERAPVHADAVRDEREEREDELGALVRELEARVGELEGELAAARGALAASERKREIERAAREADALDAETVALLTELSVGAMEEPDVRAAVDELRRDKPFLFRPKAGPARASAAMSASLGPPVGAPDALDELADEARASGDRRALLAYLRRRRGR